MASRVLYLLDISSYIYRAFHAIRGLANSRGFPTNAAFGVTNMLLKVLREHQPQYLALSFDSKAPTFRHREYPLYKAHRPPMPEDLAMQLPYIQKIVQGLNLPTAVAIDYDNVALFARRAAPGFRIEYLVLVVSQFGPNQVDVFGFGKMQGVDYPPDETATAGGD